jgi:hypothetical protein
MPAYGVSVEGSSSHFECSECSHRWDPASWTESHLIYCEHCDDDFCPDEFHNQDVCHQNVCGGSDDVSSSGNYRIMNYSYVPRLQFFGQGDYHLGVELEISANTDNVDPIHDWAADNGVPGLFYCKEDGSVAGFEIVTHPMTPTFFEGVNWEGFFRMLNTEYPNIGANGKNFEPAGHGMHVHVSRTAFPNELSMARWSWLLNRHEGQVSRVARRSSSQWARFNSRPLSELLSHVAQSTAQDVTPARSTRVNCSVDHRCDYCQQGYDGPDMGARWRWEFGCGTTIRFDDNPEYARIMRTRKFTKAGMLDRYRNSGTYPERYRAVNLIPENTLEVRVFRSTRSAGHFRDAVRLVYSSVDYVRNMQPRHKTNVSRELVSWARYVAFVMDYLPEFYSTLNPGQPRDSRGRFAPIPAA